jgi:hypothetical protein
MWALNFKKCIKCGTTERKHLGRGLCESCYRKDIESRYKSGKGPRRWIEREKMPHRVLTEEYLIKEYCENNRSLTDIAKETSCSRQYVHKQMISFGIELRSKTLARTLALKKGKIIVLRKDEAGNTEALTFQKTTYKEDFFQTWSPEMAYVLGVIYTDGNLSPGRIRDPSSKTTLAVPRVSVGQKEPELLTKILSLMESNAKLLFRKRKAYKPKNSDNKEIVAGEMNYFHLHGDKIYDELLSLGLSPNKSLDIEFPKVPPEYVRHFIRGCWDGDGSIYFEKATGNKAASFVSGSKAFIEGMLAELEKAGLPRRNIHEIKRKNISYYFRFTGQQCDQLFHFLYYGVPPSQYLTRKYELFKKGISTNN